jgi:hypothetical protein
MKYNCRSWLFWETKSQHDAKEIKELLTDKDALAPERLYVKSRYSFNTLTSSQPAPLSNSVILLLCLLDLTVLFYFQVISFVFE